MSTGPQNGIIESTMLGDGRGALTYMIHIRDTDSIQGAGGFALTNFQHLGLHLQALMTVIGVDSWEQLPGKAIRFERNGGRIISIGHIVKPLWILLDPPSEKITEKKDGILS